MLELFLPLKSFLKLEEVRIDNNVFRLHYKITVLVLILFALLVTTKQFFGDPIHCMGENDKNKDAINSYCWIYGTYTLKSSLVGKIGVDMVHRGVGPLKGENDEEVKHAYYQWVCFVLLGQAIMFYIPRYLWKIWEAGRLKALTSDLNYPVAPKGLEKYENRRKEVVDYLSCSSANAHKTYALKFAFCELLNLINVISQIFIMDAFLDGSFRNYGSAISAFIGNEDETAPNPMDKYFPKLTKCAFRYYGSSGSVQTIDRLCVLPLNIVNEKIFAVMWFWLIILSCISGLSLIYRILVFTFPRVRKQIIMSQVRCLNKNIVSKIVSRCNYGDWFVLHSLGRNMNPLLYKDLLLELADEFDGGTLYSKSPIITCEKSKCITC